MKMNVLPTTTSIAPAIWALAAQAQAPDLGTLPPYEKEFEVVGRLWIAGSELKGNADLVAEGFKKLSGPYTPIPAAYLRLQLKKLD